MNKKYSGTPHIENKTLDLISTFTEDDFVFVCSCNDLFGDWVPTYLIETVLNAIKARPDTSFLLLTKNPCRYKDFQNDIPKNCALGATIETDLTRQGFKRLIDMLDLREWDYAKFVSVEPIEKFSPRFAAVLIACKLGAIAVGYNNNPTWKLEEEPSLQETLHFISQLEQNGETVFRKTIREAC
jgi:protein gp37